MKVVILAGGLGTRISEESELKPKPLIEIGNLPIIWHIMKIYSHYGFNDFVICLGYKGYLIKEYFSNYFLHKSDVTFDYTKEVLDVKFHHTKSEPWKVSLIDTGQDTMTGSRIKRIKNFLNNETFMMTYGDGVGDIDIDKLLHSHKEKGKLATMTTVLPPGRFGAAEIDAEGLVTDFLEKPTGDGNFINGGFFVLEPQIFDLIDNSEDVVWEDYPLKKLSSDLNLNSYHHGGFWQPMDTLREKKLLEDLWAKNNAPWKLWD